MINIEIKGHLDEKWTEWFDGMSITYTEKNTILSGNIKDDSSLHGVLNRIRDLNLKLISVITYDENNKQKIKECQMCSLLF